MKLLHAMGFLAGLLGIQNALADSPTWKLGLGAQHSCAVRIGDLTELWCWGLNSRGQSGGSAEEESVRDPRAVMGLPKGIRSVVAGLVHTCALSEAGKVFCWGSNHDGQLGSGALDDSATSPREVEGLGARALAISAGLWHTCALTDDGRAWCWGLNSDGELGDRQQSGSKSVRPVQVLLGDGQPLEGARLIAAGGTHSCAAVESGVFCWGWNLFGQLGDDKDSGRLSMTAVRAYTLGPDVTALALGDRHSCAVASGRVLCWGMNSFGGLGDGTAMERATPLPVEKLPARATGVAAGSDHTCAIVEGGEVYCWGYNGWGQLGGESTAVQEFAPVESSVTGAVEISASGDHVCASLEDGTVRCWGKNTSGELGDPTYEHDVGRVPLVAHLW